jgi:hypothetical protein
VIRRHSQNIRPDHHPKSEASASVLALRLQEALERAKAARQTQPAQGE